MLTRSALASTALVAVLATSGFAQNLLSNPGFDVQDGSTCGWNAFGNSFGDLSTFNLSPPASLKMFGTFSGGFNVSGVAQRFPTTPGTEWGMSCYSQVMITDPIFGEGPPDANWAVMKIAFFDACGTEIGSNEAIIADGTRPFDEWVFNEPISAIAPDGTGFVEGLLLFLQPCSGGICDGGAAFVDDVDLFQIVGCEGSTTARYKGAGKVKVSLTGYQAFTQYDVELRDDNGNVVDGKPVSTDGSGSVSLTFKNISCAGAPHRIVNTTCGDSGRVKKTCG